MIKKVYIVGYGGNMGRRYRAVLDYLGISHCGEDIDVSYGKPEDCDGILIATPTNNHLYDIDKFSKYNRPILCEKPIWPQGTVLPDINLQMVNQYAFTGPWPGGVTYYNNWNTGRDGLAWDCVNIIGLAEGEVIVENSSPIWKCTINGKDLTLNDIDNAYVKMIAAWCKKPRPNIEYILRANEKVRLYLESSAYRNTSPLN